MDPDDMLGLVDEYRKEQRENGDIRVLRPVKNIPRIRLTAHSVFDSDTEAGIVSVWTPDGPAVIEIDSVATGAVLLDELLATMQRLARADRYA